MLEAAIQKPFLQWEANNDVRGYGIEEFEQRQKTAHLVLRLMINEHDHSNGGRDRWDKMLDKCTKIIKRHYARYISQSDI